MFFSLYATEVLWLKHGSRHIYIYSGLALTKKTFFFFLRLFCDISIFSVSIFFWEKKQLFFLKAYFCEIDKINSRNAKKMKAKNRLYWCCSEQVSG